MDRSYLDVTVCLCFAVVTLFSFATGQGVVGGTMSIKCGVVGTYTYPGWMKNSVEIITTEGRPEINPTYVSRIKYNTDKTTLIVTQLESSDAGNYSCTVSSNGYVLTTVTVNLSEAIIGIKCFGVSVAVCVFFVLTRVNDTVVIIKCIHILITEHNKQSKGKKEDRKFKILVVRVILIIAIVIFLAVYAWFIAMRATVDAFQEMTQSNCNVYIGLLSFEVCVFVLDVCLTIYLFYID